MKRLVMLLAGAALALTGGCAVEVDDDDDDDEYCVTYDDGSSVCYQDDHCTLWVIPGTPFVIPDDCDTWEYGDDDDDHHHDKLILSPRGNGVTEQ